MVRRAIPVFIGFDCLPFSHLVFRSALGVWLFGPMVCDCNVVLWLCVHACPNIPVRLSTGHAC